MSVDRKTLFTLVVAHGLGKALKKCLQNNSSDLLDPNQLTQCSYSPYRSLTHTHKHTPYADQGRSHHFKSGGDGMSSVIPFFYSVNPCLIDRFYFQAYIFAYYAL